MSRSLMLSALAGVALGALSSAHVGERAVPALTIALVSTTRALVPPLPIPSTPGQQLTVPGIVSIEVSPYGAVTVENGDARSLARVAVGTDPVVRPPGIFGVAVVHQYPDDHPLVENSVTLRTLPGADQAPSGLTAGLCPYTRSTACIISTTPLPIGPGTQVVAFVVPGRLGPRSLYECTVATGLTVTSAAAHVDHSAGAFC